MKTLFYYIPPIVALLFYAFLTLTSGLGSINPMVWFFVVLLFIAAFLLTKNKWWGALLGLVVGIVLLWMSSQYSGQPIDIERPIGIALSLFYITCGTVLFARTKK